MMRLCRAIAAGLLVALLASACGSSSTTGTASDIAPFDAVLIELFGTSDTEAYLVDQEYFAAELVVGCMNDAGFEFEIPPPPEQTVSSPTSAEQAKAEGFGIVSRFRRQVAAIDQTELSDEDKNVAYLSTLSSSEIDRFFLTLDGEPAEAGQRPDNAGCNGLASDQAYADWLRFFEALPNYTSLGEERDTHPDWLAARVAWRDCMVDRGFDYAEPDVIRADVLARMRATVDEIYPERQLPVVENADGSVILDPAVDELLADLSKFEQDAAVADFECTTPIADQFAAVETLVQQGFIDRNQSTIDELLAAQG